MGFGAVGQGLDREPHGRREAADGEFDFPLRTMVIRAVRRPADTAAPQADRVAMRSADV
ncbi:hypothetical protein ACQP2U_04375 [Nocardia sp. CA-084685]|uniref:hypothetical protein n=1 Tax=Nocardia sp. CA-084685 TaxID=3239970 RepID=UPI003D9862F2